MNSLNIELSIKPAIEELQRMFELLNDKYFKGELEIPIITLHTDTTSGAYGWITVNKVWSNKQGTWFREINLCAEHLHRDAVLIVATLLHEMCHLYNILHEIKDCSRGGKYHNVKFKKTAEEHGLMVEKTEKYGYSTTTPTQELKRFVVENVRGECFELERIKTGRRGKSGGVKQSTRKYSCPVCSLIMRASKDVTGKLMCIDCNAVFISVNV
jgi:hypothetical protein